MHNNDFQGTYQFITKLCSKTQTLNLVQKLLLHIFFVIAFHSFLLVLPSMFSNLK